MFLYIATVAIIAVAVVAVVDNNNDGDDDNGVIWFEKKQKTITRNQYKTLPIRVVQSHHMYCTKYGS